MSESKEFEGFTSGSRWRHRLQDELIFPYIGHDLKPLPLRQNPARTEKVSSYVELDFLEFLEEYAARMGSRSVSEALRRLAIIGAIAEGYHVEQQGDTK